MTRLATAPAVRPFFLPGSSGRLFTLYFPPAASGPARSVLFFPPFAEEMNKSRRMAALQARRFAQAGCGVMLIDLFGTGDSAGDFADARLDIWRDDLRRAARWLQEQNGPRLVFWGLRLGAILALDVAREFAADLDRMVLWQPVVKGEQFMTQFLRLRLAADLMGQGEKVTTQDLRNAAYSGQRLEVAGYTLDAALLRALDAVELKTLAVPAMGRIEWMEVAADAQRPLTPASRAVVASWEASGVHVRVTTVVGEAFWSAPEITVAPELIAATAAQLLDEQR